jgi:hypothetical protein
MISFKVFCLMQQPNVEGKKPSHCNSQGVSLQRKSGCSRGKARFDLGVDNRANYRSNFQSEAATGNETGCASLQQHLLGIKAAEDTRLRIDRFKAWNGVRLDLA